MTSDAKETESKPGWEGNTDSRRVYASDPVCGMDVGIETAELMSEAAGETYFFCSQSCKNRFDNQPQKYL